jgi:hypothetical protein
MHRILIANTVHRALAAASGALIVTLALTIAPPIGQAQDSPTAAITGAQCPRFCPLEYKPVTCKMSDGRVRTFPNRCFANIHACRHRLTIIGCRSALD